MNSVIHDRMERLRELMRREHLSAFIFPSTDPHQSEYTADHWKGREFISGFDGSAGTAVVTLTAAALWTDSRYFIAAGQQLQGTGFELMKERVDGTPTIDQYLGCTDLLGWMLDHESDYYYQTNFNPMTDYPDSPEMLIRPYGEYGDESHMNCAGFIAHMLKSAGGELSVLQEAITDVLGHTHNAFLRLSANEARYVEPIEEDDDDDEIVSEPVTETVTEAFETPEVEITQTFEDFTPAEDSTDNE